jgi:hypothetical protein
MPKPISDTVRESITGISTPHGKFKKDFTTRFKTKRNELSGKISKLSRFTKAIKGAAD